MTEIDELRARINALESDNVALRRAMDELVPGPWNIDASSSDDAPRPVSRRRLLGAGVGAVAAGVAAVVSGPAVASAHDADDVRLGADNPVVPKRTLLVIANSSTADAFVGLTRNTGAGVVGQSTAGGSGVKGFAGDGVPPAAPQVAGVAGIGVISGSSGVYGKGEHAGLYGESTSGYGLYASSQNGAGVNCIGKDAGIQATSTDPSGAGVVAGGATGVWASGSDFGVDGHCSTGAGVHGESSGNVGVSGHGPTGVEGISSSLAGVRSGVVGESPSPKGRGVYGHSTSSTNGTGVYGFAEASSGVAVRGIAFNGGQGKTYGTGVVGVSGPGADTDTQRSNTGVAGVGVGPGGTGVYGAGARGGVFAGQFAQLRLLVNQQPRPETGQLGDFYLDGQTNLWFCKGGADWVQVA